MIEFPHNPQEQADATFKAIERTRETVCVDPRDLHVDPWILFSQLPLEYMERAIRSKGVSMIFGAAAVRDLQSFVGQIRNYNNKLRELQDSIHEVIGEKLEAIRAELQPSPRVLNPSYTEQMIYLLLLEAAVPVPDFDLRNNVVKTLDSYSSDAFSKDEVAQIVGLSQSLANEIITLRQSLCQQASELEHNLRRKL